MDVEAARLGLGLAALEGVAVDHGGVGVLDDDALVLRGPLAPGPALLAALEPHGVANVDAVVEDVVDRRRRPVPAAGPGCRGSRLIRSPGRSARTLVAATPTSMAVPDMRVPA